MHDCDKIRAWECNTNHLGSRWSANGRDILPAGFRMSTSRSDSSLSNMKDRASMTSENDQEATYSRRQFFPMLVQEFFVLLGTAKRGGSGCQLDELDQLPLEQFYAIKPVVNPEYEIFPQNGYVYARIRGSQESHELFPVNSDSVKIFNWFNGQRTIMEIAEYLAQEAESEADATIALVREVFLALTKRMICLPKDPIAPLEIQKRGSEL
jgi:hypothetical protein